MRIVLIVIIFCVNISGCAAFRDGDQEIGGLFDLTPLNPWMRAGISYRDQLEWQDLNCKTTESALSWKNSGFTLEDAKRMHSSLYFSQQNGCIISSQTANKWKDTGFNVLETIYWIGEKNIFARPEDDIEPELAAKWKAVGFEAREALFWLQWHEIRDYPSKAADLKKAGVSHQKVYDWKSDISNSPDEVAAWVNNGITLDLAKKWKKSGFTANGAKNWANAGFIVPHEAKEWRNAQFEPAEATQWYRNNFKTKIASQWRDSGFDAEGALNWQNSNLEPKVASLWRDAGKTPEEQLKWPGLNPEQADKIKNDCKSGLLELVELLRVNPYEVADKCYNYIGQTTQILSKNRALFSIGGSNIVHLRFKEQSVPMGYFKGIVKGGGVYRYQTVTGAQLIVPDLEVVIMLR